MSVLKISMVKTFTWSVFVNDEWICLLWEIAPIANTNWSVGRPETHVVGNQGQLNSAWKIFGVAPQSWQNSTTTTANIAAPSHANRKYQQTSLWWLYPSIASSPVSNVSMVTSHHFCGWLKLLRLRCRPGVQCVYFLFHFKYQRQCLYWSYFYCSSCWFINADWKVAQSLCSWDINNEVQGVLTSLAFCVSMLLVQCWKESSIRETSLIMPTSNLSSLTYTT